MSELTKLPRNLGEETNSDTMVYHRKKKDFSKSSKDKRKKRKKKIADDNPFEDDPIPDEIQEEFGVPSKNKENKKKVERTGGLMAFMQKEMKTTDDEFDIEEEDIDEALSNLGEEIQDEKSNVDKQLEKKYGVFEQPKKVKMYESRKSILDRKREERRSQSNSINNNDSDLGIDSVYDPYANSTKSVADDIPEAISTGVPSTIMDDFLTEFDEDQLEISKPPKSPGTKRSRPSSANRHHGAATPQTISDTKQFEELFANFSQKIEATLDNQSKGELDSLREKYSSSLEEKNNLLTKINKLNDALEEARKDIIVYKSERANIEEAVKKEIEIRFEREIKQLTVENATLKNEIRSSKETYESEIKRLKSEMERKISSLEQQSTENLEAQSHRHEREKKYLENLFKMEKESIERAHKQAMEKQENLYESEISKNSRYIDIENKLSDLVKQVSHNSQEVCQSKDKVTEEKYQLLKDKEDDLVTRERFLKEMEKSALQQKENIERERSRLQSLYVTLEAKLTNLLDGFEQEKQNFKLESAKFEAKRRNLEQEHRKKLDELYSEREQLDEERAKFLVEKNELMNKWQKERKELSKLKSEMLAFKETSLREQASAIQEISQRELDVNTIRSKIEHEYELMKERKAIIEKTRAAMEKERASLAEEKEKFREQTQQLTHTALEVQKDSEMIVHKHEEVMKEKINCERLKEEALQLKNQADAMNQQFEAKNHEISLQKKNLDAERQSFLAERQRMKEEQKEIGKRMETVRNLEIKLNEQLMLVGARAQQRDDRLLNDFSNSNPPKQLFSKFNPNATPHSVSLKEELEFWEHEDIDTSEALKEQTAFLEQIQQNRRNLGDESSFTPLKSFEV